MPDLPEWALRLRLERRLQAAFQLRETGGQSGPRMPHSKTPGPVDLPPGEHRTPSSSALIALMSTLSAKVVSGVGCCDQNQ